MVKEHCTRPNVSEPDDFTKRVCPGFAVLPRKAAYAYAYPEWYKLFEPQENQYTGEKLKESFAVHYWNYMRVAAKKTVIIQQDQPLYRLFRENCRLTEDMELKYMIGEPY